MRNWPVFFPLPVNVKMSFFTVYAEKYCLRKLFVIVIVVIVVVIVVVAVIVVVVVVAVRYAHTLLSSIYIQ